MCGTSTHTHNAAAADNNIRAARVSSMTAFACRTHTHTASNLESSTREFITLRQPWKISLQLAQVGDHRKSPPWPIARTATKTTLRGPIGAKNPEKGPIAGMGPKFERAGRWGRRIRAATARRGKRHGEDLRWAGNESCRWYGAAVGTVPWRWLRCRWLGCHLWRPRDDSPASARSEQKQTSFCECETSERVIDARVRLPTPGPPGWIPIRPECIDFECAVYVRRRIRCGDIEDDFAPRSSAVHWIQIAFG